MGEWRSGRIDGRVEHVERVDFNAEARRFCTVVVKDLIAKLVRSGRNKMVNHVPIQEMW